MRQTLSQTRLRLAAFQQRIESADLFAFFTVLVVTYVSAIITSQEIANYQWEQLAKEAFYARMPTLVVVEPPFNFVRDEQLITATVLGLLSVVIWVILTRWSLSAMRLANRRTPPRSSSPAFDASAPMQAIRESLKRGVDAWQSPLWPADLAQGDKPKVPEYQPDPDLGDLSFEYVDFDYKDPAELRAFAETSFRLAAGPVSSRLAEELEILGQTLQREADAAECARSHHRKEHQH